MEPGTSLPRRQEMDAAYQWNAESVFPTRDDWRTEAEQWSADLPVLDTFRGRLSESPTVLADAFDRMQALVARLARLRVYAGMASSVDTDDPEALGLRGLSMTLTARYLAAAAFVDPELIALGAETLTAWRAREPRLAFLEPYCDNLFRLQKHVRSAEVEAVLGMANDPLMAIGNIYGQLTDADLDFPPAVTETGARFEVAQSTIEGTKHSPDRELRRTAWESYSDEYLAHKKTLSAALIASYKADVFLARARHYPTALDASLFRNNVPRAVYDNLIETFRKNLPTWHRYWRIRRKALGVETLYPYDIWAPLTPNKPTVPYEQAVEWIAAGMAPLGEEYVNVLRRGCGDERWVDVYPNQGKTQGAFSSGAKGTHPFIMMSYTDDLESMSTLAHELGHSMHSYFTRGTQPALYANYSMFVAETASNFNQALTRAYLFRENADRDFQISLIEEAMSNFHRYFFIMPTLARFELEIHTRVEAGKTPTAEEMIEYCADLFEEGYGGEMGGDRQRIGITFAQFRHLFMAYYVFNYATGLSAAHAISKRILDGVPGAVESYLTALRAGNTVYPVETLDIAGIDMRTPEPVEQTFAILADMVDRLETLTA
ncbi:MAG: oligoendopeptidase F [Capsulimonadales bacterium]|nr:oligoendopeptidase F [Capsulimonadales bacterium]